ncbi:SH3 domain-containing protein [Bacillus sp. 1P06AnD]|uniref:SH3 domain-containing protein n=1 Tax=Bacillus sp. 1P06AnD TaxID=3132208 RepID=UPI0039A39E7C
MLKNNIGKIIMSFLFACMVMVAFSMHDSAEAATIQNGTIDKVNGNVEVKAGAGSQYKTIGSLARSTKVKVYNQLSSGWSEIDYNGKKAYISSDYVRFYKTTSLYSVKLVADHLTMTQRDAMKYTPATKASIYKRLSIGMKEPYLTNLFKQQFVTAGKDKGGNILYKPKYNEISGLEIDNYDWYLRTEAAKPTFIFYKKKNTLYLEISQFHKSALDNSHTTIVYATKDGNAPWLAYNIVKRYPK